MQSKSTAEVQETSKRKAMRLVPWRRSVPCRAVAGASSRVPSNSSFTTFPFSPQVLRLAGTYEVQQHALLTACSYLLICVIILSCSHEVNEIHVLTRPSLSHGFVLMLFIFSCRFTNLQTAQLGYGYRLEGQSPLAILPSSVRSRHPPGTQCLETLS